MNAIVPKRPGPVSQKVLVGTITGISAAMLTWMATAWIWPGGIPPALAQLIPSLASVTGYAAGGWLARHRATAAEVAAALQEASVIIGLVRHETEPPA